MRIVIDASIALDWFYQDEQRSKARELAKVLAGDASATAPAIWWFEVRNAMLMGIRRKRTTEARVRSFLTQLTSAAIEISGFPDDIRVADLAIKHGLSFYDACYLELAIRQNCPLATLDIALAKAAASEGVRLMTPP